jgi:aminomethyltransferase
VQGPRALEILAPLADIDVAALKYYFCHGSRRRRRGRGHRAHGYTGEDGFELFVSGERRRRCGAGCSRRAARSGSSPPAWARATCSGSKPGCRCTASNLSEELSPLAGGQKWAVKLNKGDFVGREAPWRPRLGADDYRASPAFVMDGRVPARTGYPVFVDGRRVGEVRSASFSPSYGGRNIGTVLVEKAAAAEGVALGVEVRGTVHGAHVVPLPFYKRS